MHITISQTLEKLRGGGELEVQLGDHRYGAARTRRLARQYMQQQSAATPPTISGYLQST